MTSWLLGLGVVLASSVAGALGRPVDQEPPDPPPAAPDAAALRAKFTAAQAKHLAGEVEPALALMKEVLDADPKSFDLALSITRWLTEVRSDFAGAEPFARRAYELDPRSAEATNLFGSALVFRGENAQAEQIYRAGVERFPADASLRYGLAMACGQQKKYLEAKAEYAAAIALDPNQGLFHFSAGENLANLRDFEAAERELRLAVKLKGHADAAWRLGETLAKQGQDVEAEQILRAALNDGPKLTQWNCALQLGIFFFERARHGEAASILKQATDRHPTGRDAWMWLARAQRALGKEDAAARSIKKYQELRAKEDRDEEERLLGLIKAQLEGRHAGVGTRESADSKAEESGAGKNGVPERDEPRRS